METWRAIMTQGAYTGHTSSKASRYGVLDDDSDKLAQPLISRRDSYSHYDDDRERTAEWDDTEHEHDPLLQQSTRTRVKGPEEASPATVLWSLVSNVLWPMTAVGAQTAKVYKSRPVSARETVAVDVDDHNALRTVTTLRELTVSRRRVETMDDIHERALVRLALVTLVCSAWLIMMVYYHAD